MQHTGRSISLSCIWSGARRVIDRNNLNAVSRLPVRSNDAAIGVDALRRKLCAVQHSLPQKAIVARQRGLKTNLDDVGLRGTRCQHRTSADSNDCGAAGNRAPSQSARTQSHTHPRLITTHVCAGFGTSHDPFVCATNVTAPATCIDFLGARELSQTEDQRNVPTRAR